MRCIQFLVLLATLHASLSFTCSDNGVTDVLYHADVSTGCQVYHVCENSQLSTLTCPPGQAFSAETSRCEASSSVSCHETPEDEIHHPHKRSIEDQVHTIDIQDLKTKLVGAYHSLKPTIENIVKDIAPSLYDKFQQDYLPAIRATRQDVLPFFYERIYPHVQTWTRYFLRVAGKVVDKAYTSYKLSNSTHIAIVSMSDIADDVSRQLAPVLNLGKFLSASLIKSNEHVRHKRQAAPDFFSSLTSPFVDNMLKSASSTLFGDGNSMTSQLILPTIYDIIGDPESRFDAMKVFMSAKAAFTPLVWHMMRESTYNTPEGTIVKVPRQIYDKAVQDFLRDSKPILFKLAGKHLQKFFFRLGNNVPILLNSADRLIKSDSQKGEIFKDHLQHFLNKHRTLFRQSTGSHVNFYTLREILADLQPIKITLMEIVMDYLRKNPNSLVNVFFGEGSFLQRQMMGTPVYAKPRPVTSNPYARNSVPVYAKPSARINNSFAVRNRVQPQRG